jgi:hypothetical protein
MTRRRSLAVVLGSISALVLFPIVSWVAVNVIHEERPRPRWSEADLVPVPPAGDNGWSTISDAREKFSGVDLAAFAIANDAALSPEVDLQEAKGELAGPRATFEAAPVAPLFDICSRALQERFFVDATPLALGESPPAIPLLRCHQLATYAVLLHASDGDWTSAGEGAHLLVSRWLELVPSSRTFLGYVGAAGNATQALELATQIERWHPGACAPELEASVEAFEPGDAAPHHAIRGEYILVSSGIDLIASGAGATPLTGWPAFAFDPGQTQRAIDSAFTRLENGLEPSAPTDPWWWENAVGSAYLSATIPAGGGIRGILEREPEELLAARRDLLHLLGERRP